MREKIRDFNIRRNKKCDRNTFEIMKVCFDSLEIIKKMAIKGNPNSITDVGVAMHCVKASINGAFLNVKINCNELKDKSL